MMKRKLNNQKGFTLIELLTALSIFAVIMTISMGSILGVFDSNRKSRAMRSVMANLNLAVENMSKEIRFGRVYHCGSGNASLPQNCPGGSSTLSFLSEEEVLITYNLNSSNVITKEIDSDNDLISLTAPEVVIDELYFYVLGADTNNTLQPKVIIKLKAHAGSGRSRTDLTLQTMVSQRELDI